MDLQNLLSNIAEITNYAFLKILIIILLALIAQKLVKAIIEWLFRIRVKSNFFTTDKKERAKRLKTLSSISEATAGVAVWFVAIISILGVLKFPIGPLITSAGLVGAALAFSTQSLIKDYITGIFIIAENQYRVGDFIEVDKVSGVVEAVTVRTTIIKGENGALYFVPNGSITTTANHSFAKIHALQKIEVSTEMTLDKLEETLNEIANKISKTEELSKFISLGPSLVSIDKITTKANSLTISFDTTPKKRNHANNIIFKELTKAKVPFA